jgi:ribosomal protein L40E
LVESEENKIICSQCGAEYELGTDFCTNCGSSLSDEETEKGDSVEVSNCTKCGAILGSHDAFCRECGTKIEVITHCPQCQSEIKPGDMFCTECGINVYEYEASGPIASKKDPVKDLKNTGDEIFKDVEKTGRGLMKDVGSFLDKASQGSSKKKIKPKRKDQRYLVCDTCFGYYQLQAGEEAEDFSDKCECGGNLECKDTPPV